MLVLLCFNVKGDYCEVFFKPEICSGTMNGPRCWYIKSVQIMLGRAVCNNMLFEHAILGCDTTSRVFNIGKRLALKLIHSDNHFITQAGIFQQWHIKRRRSSPSMSVHSYSGWHTRYTEVADLSPVGSHQYTFCAAWKPSSDVTSSQVP